MHTLWCNDIQIEIYNCSKDAIQCSFDYYYNELSDALEDWEDKISEDGWHEIDDPLPYCQHDTFLPIRVKGRDLGEPVWGELEILKDGKWKYVSI